MPDLHPASFAPFPGQGFVLEARQGPRCGLSLPGCHLKACRCPADHGEQRGFGAPYTLFCQTFTALINHLLAKLTLGNCLWTLILFAGPIWLPWILAVAEACPTGIVQDVACGNK